MFIENVQNPELIFEMFIYSSVAYLIIFSFRCRLTEQDTRVKAVKDQSMELLKPASHLSRFVKRMYFFN